MIGTPLVLSLGDPAGIGPELIAQSWAQRREHNLPPFFVMGGASIIEAAARTRGLDVPTHPIDSPGEAVAAFDRFLPVLGRETEKYTPGKPDEAGAKLALWSLQKAAELTISGDAAGLVTGPIAKSLLAQVGFDHPGQTEFMADICGVAPDNAVMMLAGPQLRTVPITVHCALSEVSGRLSIRLIEERATVVASALQQDFGLKRPRLAITGLNPHAGEDGKFGHEEADIIAPAIARLFEKGIDATGPHAADALFAPRGRDAYDVAICMYHDQALIPLKALDFDSGVNVTLGLPIIRTSPDHGTAFAIAGRGLANAGATIVAIKMAGECARRRAG